MKFIYSAISFINEFGVIATFALMLGYFGSRSLLGWLPLFCAIVLVVCAFGLAYALAIADSPDDGYSEERFPWLDKFIFYSLLFICGMAGFATIGNFI